MWWPERVPGWNCTLCQERHILVVKNILVYIYWNANHPSAQQHWFPLCCYVWQSSVEILFHALLASLCSKSSCIAELLIRAGLTSTLSIHETCDPSTECLWTQLLLEVQRGSALIAVFRYTRQNNLWFIHETAICCHGDVLASTVFTETFLLCLFQRVHRSCHRLLSRGCNELQSYGWGKHVIMAVVWGRNVYVAEKVEREGGF